jgi:hypothetical protein
MKKTINKQPQTSALELGKMIGQRRAFASIGGICSATEAASLKKIRDDKMYLGHSKGWREFCKDHLRMARSTADKIIGLLNEFGPEYFAVAQLTKITPERYRAIAPSFRENAVHFMGEAIALLPDNTDKVAVAIDELQKIAAPPPDAPPEPAPPLPVPARVELLEQRSRDLVAELNELLDRVPVSNQQELLLGAVHQMRIDLTRVELRITGLTFTI